ncbi:MAG: phosphotransferase family protein [Burkholderiales bacterium]
MITTNPFDVERLDAYLRHAVPGLEGSPELTPIAGGQSNPTFFLSYANRRLVLRKQPASVLPSAHAVDREFRVMNALRNTDVPVPTMVAYCDDREVIGTPFYVMDRLEGRVFNDPTLPGVSPADRRAMYLNQAEVLARLHHVDWQGVGLGDYGKPGNYFTRQLARWTKQWALSKTREIPEIDRLIEWLPAHLPAEEPTTIAHGDYRIGNLMFHATEPRVIGVLDWELSTLGDPLADAAYSCLGWHLPRSHTMGVQDAGFVELGIPTEAEYLAHYDARSGRPGRMQPFHIAFSLFRLAVISEGIAQRARDGVASAANAAAIGETSVQMARCAVAEAGL